MAMLSTAFVSIGTKADSEPNDDFAGAEPITGGMYSGTLTDPDDSSDYYKFDFTPGHKIEVAVTSNSDELSAYIANPDETWLAQVDGSSTEMTYMDYQTAYETSYTYCYLKFETNAGDIDYSFQLVFTYSMEGGSGDAPADRTEGFFVTEGPIMGKLNSGSDDPSHSGEDGMDCYRFWAGEGDRISITFSTLAQDNLYLNLLDPEQNYIFQDLASKQDIEVSEQFWTANETGLGVYYFEVYQDVTPGEYTISLDIERQNDGETGEDAPVDTTFSPIVYVGNVQGHLEDLDMVDMFKFTAGKGDVISIGFRGFSEGDYLYFDLFDQSILPLASNKSSSADSGIQLSFYTANETPVQAFYMKVWMDTAPGDYVITLGIEKQNDAGLGIDVPGASNTETMLAAGSYEGWVYDLDTADMYMINLTGGDILTVILLIADGTSALWRLLNSTLIGILAEGMSNIGTPSTLSYYYDGMMGPQTCYLKIYDGHARYSLGIALSRQNDAGSGTDAPGTASASMLSQDPLSVEAGSHSGYLHNSGDMFDSYLINVTGGHRLNITVTPSSGLGINAMLYGDGVAQYAMDLLNAQGVAAYLQYDFAADDWAQFIVHINSGVGDYSFVVSITEIPGEVNTTPSAPVLTATPGSMKVTLTWTASADDGGTAVTGYNIYRKESGTIVAATMINSVGAGVLTYEDTYIMLGKTYEYYVKAENAIGEGAASNTVTASPLAEETDSDGDGIPNSVEDDFGLNKDDPSDGVLDKDSDGFSNFAEYTAGSRIDKKESTPLDLDGDGMPNDWEISFEFNPGNPSDADDDPDNDGRDNLQEYKDGTNPKVKDVAIGGDDDEAEVTWVGVCCGGSFLAIIVPLIIILLVIASILIIILLVVASRKKKAKAEE